MTVQPAPRLLITRPRAASEAFAAKLEAAMPGAWAIEIAPLIEIRATGARPEWGGVSDVIFTSANAVRIAGRPPQPGPLRAHCVGPATTEAARAAGFEAEMRGETAAALASRISRWPVEPPRRFLHLRGAHGVGDVAATLRASGHEAREQILYEQQSLGLSDEVKARLRHGAFEVVTLFSPRSAKLLGEQTGTSGIGERTVLCCLSNAVAQAAARYHDGQVLTANSPDGAAMIRLLHAARAR